MALKEFYYRWQWPLKSSPQALWPLVADTNRFNHDALVPSIEDLTSPNDPPGHHHLRAYITVGGFRLMRLEWDEEPFEWSRPHRFGVLRTYSAGPLKSMRIHVELSERADGGTDSTYEVWATPSGLLGLIGTPVQIKLMNEPRFRGTLERYDSLAEVYTQSMELSPGPVRFSSGGEARLETLSRSLSERGGKPEIVERLVDVLRHADDITVGRLRPYELADDWNMPRRDVLETFLYATRAGMLNFRWDVLCPLCRGARLVADTLGGIQNSVHCSTCNIDFNVNFDRSVELTFKPNPAIRDVELTEFCIAGPQVTPHIAVQQLMADGEERTVAPILEPGRYRLRALRAAGGCYFQAQDGGQSVFRFDLTGQWPTDEPTLSLSPSLTLVNHLGGEQVLIVEHLAWSDQAVTAAEVTTTQVFRDLFSSEALRPGEQISVGTLTVLFTDLRDSTRLYRQIGDAPAFGLVMDHFAVLTDSVAAENGAVVKTIGDAIMAVFPRPVNAVRAAVRAQAQVAAISHHALGLKAGIHSGPSIAVTLNNRLDYFGTTVNMAARLEGLSHGDDVIISQAIHSDPEVTALLDSDSSIGGVEPFQTSLKGFDTERFDLWRVVPARTLAVTEEQVS